MIVPLSPQKVLKRSLRISQRKINLLPRFVVAAFFNLNSECLELFLCFLYCFLLLRNLEQTTKALEHDYSFAYFQNMLCKRTFQKKRQVIVCGRDYKLVPSPFFGTWQEVEKSLKQHIFQILRHNYSLSPCFEDLSSTGQTILALNAARKKMNKKIVMKNTIPLPIQSCN